LLVRLFIDAILMINKPRLNKGINFKTKPLIIIGTLKEILNAFNGNIVDIYELPT
jgi:hypothetical protein